MMSDLLNKVAAKIPNKWKNMGIQLNIDGGRLETISTKCADDLLRFADVFELWKGCGTPPYTWATIIDALRAPSIDEVALANDLKQWVENSA